MDQNPITEVKNIGHLGIIASIFKEYRIVERINLLLPKKSNNQNVSHGEVILAMVMQGLGFNNHRFYLSAEFFSHIELKGLFKQGVRAEHFTPDTMARTLDAIYDYGPTRFFTDSCLKIVMENDLLKKFLFVDTTSLSATGKKYKGNGNIELKYGYSKDYRMDLKQLVYLLVATEDGIPVFSEAHSGNASDGKLFKDTIVKLSEIIHDEIKDKFIVLDSSLYNKKFLLDRSITGNWITRVPESIKLCKDYVEREYDKILWTKIDKDFKYVELTSSYGGKEQRWILVRNREAKYKEIATFNKRLEKEEVNIKKSVTKLEKKIYYSEKEAEREMKLLKKYHPNFIFSNKVRGHYEVRKGSKRKIKIGHRLHLSFKRNSGRISKQRLRKGRFILATNFLDDDKLSSREIISAYRSRNGNVEGCFKLLKDRTHNLNQIFLKKESRIEAMIMVMGFILFVNNLAQKKLRDYLFKNNESIATQRGGKTKKPTFKWASYILRHITSLRVKVLDKIYNEIKGIQKAQETVIKAFGDYALEIYGLK